MANKYRIDVHFNGIISYDIEADCLDEARAKAVDVFYEDGNEGGVYKTYGVEVTDESNT